MAEFVKKNDIFLIPIGKINEYLVSENIYEIRCKAFLNQTFFLLLFLSEIWTIDSLQRDISNENLSSYNL